MLVSTFKAGPLKLDMYRVMLVYYIVVAITLGHDAALYASVSKRTTFYIFPKMDQCKIKSSCNTLSYYAAKANLTTHNTEFVFGQGNYELHNNITFSNISELVLRMCENCKPAVINCTHRVGFKFEYIENLTISHLRFYQCSRIHTDMPIQFRTTTFLHTAVYIYYTSSLTLSNITIENTIGYGLFLYMLSGKSLISNSLFQNCHSTGKDIVAGNAVLAINVCDDLSDRSTLVEIRNSAFQFGKSMKFYTATGLALMLQCSGIKVMLENVVFKGNEAMHSTTNSKEVYHFSGGNLAIGFHKISTLNVISIKNCTFENGKAVYGAGLYLSYYSNSLQTCGNEVVVKDSKFLDNVAFENGGAIHVRYFQGRSSGNNSCTRRRKTLLELKNCTFDRNIVKTVKDAGAGVSIVNAYLDSSRAFLNEFRHYSIILDQCVFRNHNDTLDKEGARSSGSAVLYVSQQGGELLIKDSFFTSNGVTAVAMFRSKLYFSGNVTLYNNSGYEGGGIILCEASYLIMNPNSTITIEKNNAAFTGGGIFAESRCVQIQPPCFYQINSTHKNLTEMVKSREINISIRLVNNSANYAGSQLFGGTADYCHIPGVDEDIFHHIFNVSTARGDLSSVSSDPLNVCFCNDERVECNETSSYTVPGKLYIGQKFNISIVTVGQYDGTVPGEVEYSSSDGYIIDYLKNLPKTCGNVSLSVYSQKSGEIDITAKVKNQHANYKLNKQALLITVHMQEVPLGFRVYKNLSYMCIDKPNLYEKGFRCLIENYTAIVKRPVPKWLGYYNETDGSSGFTVYKRCPIDYCRADDVDIPTNHSFFSQDEQCANNRSGVLCGQCKEGFSLSLGSLNCYNCTSHATLKTVCWSILFLVAGIAIVILLLCTNFTITQGTVSELLFYANTVFIYKATLGAKVAAAEETAYSSTLQVVINVLNLNYGHRNCFYDGLDLVSRTWLQFLLVLYLWALTTSIVLLCRKSRWLSNRIGFNAVPTLATILLLSFSPLNLSILYSLTFASIHLPHRQDKTIVLLFDGNVSYFDRKHIPLFFAGCIFAVMSLSFIVILLFIQPLQRHSRLKPLRWINQLKPLIDAYTCPHIIKPHCRFWTGLLLFLRTVLYICYIVAFDYVLFSINIICFFIQAVAWGLGGIYTKKHLNVISSSYVINIGILSVISTFYQDIPAVVSSANSISISIAIGTMLCTFFFHAFTQLRHRNCCTRVRHYISRAACKYLLLSEDRRVMRNYLISDSDEEIESS